MFLGAGEEIKEMVMKKLLALVLVLGVASVANAGFILTGPTTLGLGAVGDYSISTDIPNLALAAFQVTSSGPAITNFAIVASPRSTADDSPINAAGWFGISAPFASGAYSSALTGPLATFRLTAPLTMGSFDITVKNDNSGNGPLGGSYDTQFNQISDVPDLVTRCVVTPEPITLSLLALGGLVALRRRHA